MNIKHNLIIGAFLAGGILNSSSTEAQILSGNAFLQGSYVELGIAACGSFGSSVNPPAGYHARTSGGNLGFVADPAKDGFNVGTPNYVGDYFLPGSPEEGFGLTINGTNYNNNQVCSEHGVTGSIINYTSNASEVSATWQGTVSGLSITAKSYIPAGAVYFVTQVTVTNTSAATVNNVFYMRNVDPDHGVYTPGAGGSNTTNNSIASQNPNTCNRALATSTTLQGNNYLGLGSIDPRAKVTMGGFSNRSAADIWNGTGLYTTGSRTADEAISISFNLGNLAPNQSTTFAYAYILSASDLDAALAATIIGYQVNSATYISGTPVDICSGVPTAVSLTNTGGYSTITWTPATGLDVTTGPNVNATITTPTTYTVSASGSCGSVQLTVPLNPINATSIGNAGPITGPGTITTGQTGITYSIVAVTGATSYIWTLPPGSTVTSATSTSNTITFNASNTPWCGNVSVTPINACANGGSSSLPVCLGSSISTGSVISPICGNAAFNVSYSFVGTYYAGNVFTAQLSDASGSFASPVTIGSVTSSSAGTISASIPAGVPAGNGYRIRVVSSSPAINGTDNGSNLRISLNPPPALTITSTTNPSCNGLSNGSITTTITGGNPGYTYTWTPDGATSASRSGIPAGTYGVTVTDAGGCQATASATLTQPAVLSTGTLSAGFGVPSCPAYNVYLGLGAQTVALGAAPSGGTAPYTYTWTPAAGLSNTHVVAPNVTPSATTTYTLSLTDGHGCATSNTIQVKVLNIHCGPAYIGRELNKNITMCHAGVTACVSPTTANNYIAMNNDCPGPCVTTAVKGIAINEDGGTELSMDGTITLYPNPAHNTVNVKLAGIGNYYKAYQVVDMMGRVMSRQNPAEGIISAELSIDISRFAAGTYIIRVVGEGDTIANARFSVE